MLRYEEGLLVESSSEKAPLAFRGRGEGCTVVHVGRDVTEVPRLRWYTWTIGHCKAADLELMSLRLGGGQHLFSLRVEVTAK